MDKFEYVMLEDKFVSGQRDWFLNGSLIEGGSFIGVLNDLGQKGWELVTSYEDDGYSTSILKRKIMT